jgi:hypothetical protein
MCVSVKHGLVIVSESTYEGGFQLHMYLMVDGSFVRTVGSKGRGKAQFSFHLGGLCVRPDGDSVLVAEADNNRVQEVRIGDGSWVRFVGDGVLNKPQFVDCNASIIAVSEHCNRISVLPWHGGGVLAQFGRHCSGPGELSCPLGLRVLMDGTGLVVADQFNDRLCVFTLRGEFVTALGSEELGLSCPFDVIECGDDGGFIVANTYNHNIVKLSRVGEVVDVFGDAGSDTGEFNGPTALAALSHGGLVVLEAEGRRLQVFGR